jgi:uncharacterized protein YndB with AHSA1/START domain
MTTSTTKRSVVHASFVLERTFSAAPARVFAAFTTLEAKKKWFSGPADWVADRREMDFRVGGREIDNGGPKGGPMSRFEAVYHDIVENTRIVYSYTMHLDDTKISVSLATFDFQPSGKGTRLVLTENGAFLDGHEDPALREEGTRWVLGQLAKALGEG